MLDGVLLLWYLLTAGSLVFIVWDLETNTPVTWVMKLAWVLVVLYTGPVGLFIYLLACRQPLPGTHDAYIAAHWKQSIGSLMHCVAGDATGIILAATVTYALRLPNGIDLIIEYASGFLVGLFVFQSLFKVLMSRTSYFSAVRQSFFPETVSMNMVMTGMLPVKAILMTKLAGADNPTRPAFWGIMALATLAGMITAYWINSWMVGRGLKHGMMSATPASSGRPGVARADRAGAGPSHAGRDAAGTGAKMTAKLTPLHAAAVIAATAAVLVAAIWVTSRIVPLRFS
ncbi:MAG: DUF4396 domain-containing protein [Longimicrobiales bacterium]